VSCWAALGVDPYSDQRTIKRAYARLLKDAHPEDHPEQFMALREAYEAAMAQASRRASDVPHRPIPSYAAEPLESINPRATPEPTPEQPVAQQADSQVEQAEAAKRERFNLRMQALAEAFHELLEDPERRRDTANWQALLSLPELSNLDIRLRHGANLLPAVIKHLADPHSVPLPSSVLVLLDNSFHWTHDQNINWPIPEEAMQRLCLLMIAAHEDLLSEPPVTGWKWFFRSMFRPYGRLTRIEYIYGQGLVVGVTVLLTILCQRLALPDTVEPYLFLLALVALYAVVIGQIKRINDSGTNAGLIFIFSILLPFMYLLFAMSKATDDLNPENPRTRFVGPYFISLMSLFRGGFEYKARQRIRVFFLSIKPSLLWVLVGVWILNLVLLFIG
tara:strand:- start:264 stop:1433 length:1170 start_codon:yes stop_codon:yes gene_type:complete